MRKKVEHSDLINPKRDTIKCAIMAFYLSIFLSQIKIGEKEKFSFPPFSGKNEYIGQKHLSRLWKKPNANATIYAFPVFAFQAAARSNLDFFVFDAFPLP